MQLPQLAMFRAHTPDAVERDDGRGNLSPVDRDARLGSEMIGNPVDALPGCCVRRIEREHGGVVIERAAAARFERMAFVQRALSGGEIARDHGLRIDGGLALSGDPVHEARDCEQRPATTANQGGRGMSVRREVAAGVGAIVDTGATTSAGEGCASSFTSVRSWAAA